MFDRKELEYILEKGGCVKPKWTKDFLIRKGVPDKTTVAQWAGFAYRTDIKAQARIVRLCEEGVTNGLLQSNDQEHTEFLVPFQDNEAVMHCASSVVDKKDIYKFLLKQKILPVKGAAIPEWEPERKRPIKLVFPEYEDLKCSELSLTVGAESVVIEAARDGETHKVPAKELGMGSSKKGMSPLFTLLYKFAELSGGLRGGEISAYKKETLRQRSKSKNPEALDALLRQHIGRLNSVLKERLPTIDSPILEYSTDSGWCMRFKSIRMDMGRGDYLQVRSKRVSSLQEVEGRLAGDMDSQAHEENECEEWLDDFEPGKRDELNFHD